MPTIFTSFLAVLFLATNPTSVLAAEANSDYCAISTDAGNVDSARALFQASCSSYTLVDCDPSDTGGWQCSSAVIGINSPVRSASNNTAKNGTANTTDSVSTDFSSTEPSVITIATPDPVMPIFTESNDAGECYVVGTGFTQSIVAFEQNCASYQRNDCDPLGNERWVCSSANVSSTSGYSDSGNTSSETSAIYLAELPTSESTATFAPVTVIPNPTNNSHVGRLASNDLLVLHYDNCPDKDDGHAIPAGKSVVEKYGINNVLAVNGTCGNSIRDRFNQSSNTVMNTVWGEQYLDAHNQNSTAIQRSVTRWAATLSNGADVWIAEGGQSDFTADVVRQIESHYSYLDLKRIHVIQHSAGNTAYNEMFTDSANLSYLKNKTSYQAIANGNVGGNGSADLNEQSFYFVVSARASRFSAEWNAGFQYLQPDCSVRTENCKLDFSDTVELLYIIDDRSTQSVNDFADKYLN